MSILSDNTDEIIALGVVLPTILVTAYQAVMGNDITMPNEIAMIIVGFYYGKTKNPE